MRIASTLVIVAALYAGSVTPLAAQSAQESRANGVRSAAPQAVRPGPFLDHRASTPAPILNDRNAARKSAAAAVAPDLTSEWIAIAVVAVVVAVVVIRMARD